MTSFRNPLIRRARACAVVGFMAVVACTFPAAVQAAPAQGIMDGVQAIQPEDPQIRVPESKLREATSPEAVKFFRERYGVSDSVARDRLAEQAQVVLGLDDLERRLGESRLGRVRFDNHRGQVVIPTTTASADAEVAEWATKSMVDSGRYRIERTTKSLATFKADRRSLARETSDELRAGNIAFDTDSDGGPVIKVDPGLAPTHRAKIADLARKHGAAIRDAEPGDLARAVPESCWYHGDSHPYRRTCDTLVGGTFLTGCTSAFFVTSPWIEPYMLTAGHCIGTVGESHWSCRADGFTCNTIGPAQNKMYGFGHGGDAGLVKITNTAFWGAYPGYMEWNPAPPQAPTHRAIWDYLRSSAPLGTVACKHGRMTGTSCGTVLDNDLPVSYGDASPFGMLKFSKEMCSIGGDSGSAVTLAASWVAVGIHSGSNGLACGSTNRYAISEPIHRALATTGTWMLTPSGFIT